MSPLNRTHAEHAAFAVLMQCIVAAFTGGWLAGAAFGAAFFFGREHAQAQRSKNIGYVQALRIWQWSEDSRLDLECPVLAVLTVLYAMGVL